MFLLLLWIYGGELITSTVYGRLNAHAHVHYECALFDIVA